MKAAELRIGNFVNLYGDECRIQTVGMWVHTDTTVDEAPIESVKPIPLTEEWLLKFGFKKPLDWHSWRLTLDNSNEDQFKSSLQLGFTGCGYVQVCRSGINAYDVKCEFVHQLQNLYFALTGEELTIKGEI